MRRIIGWVVLLCFLLILNTVHASDMDLEFDTFEEAKRAADKRGAEYDSKMREYVETKKRWENDNGSRINTSNPKEIVDHSYNEGNIGSDAGQNLQKDTEQRISDLKDKMLDTGANMVAGATAAYQWSVEYKNGRWVLSDSFSAASFNMDPIDGAKGGDEKEKEAAKDPRDSEVASKDDPTHEPEDTSVTLVSGPTQPTGQPKPKVNPNFEDEEHEVPHDYVEGVDTSLEPEKDEELASTPKSSPGFSVGMPVYEAPAVRLIIQHPTEQMEEVFSCNGDPGEFAMLSLDDFTIPEDTRVRMSIELGDTIDEDDVFMVVVDDEGETDFISASSFANYRHMFRIPSLDEYSVKIFVKDHNRYGELMPVMQVAVPVTKVDFDSRSIEHLR